MKYLEIVCGRRAWYTDLWSKFYSNPPNVPTRSFKIGRIVWVMEEGR